MALGSDLEALPSNITVVQQLKFVNIPETYSRRERERKKNAAKGGNILDVNVLYCIADDDVPVYKILKFRNNTPYLAMKLSINLNNPC